MFNILLKFIKFKDYNSQKKFLTLSSLLKNIEIKNFKLLTKYYYFYCKIDFI
jgi:hypothetical protein